MVAQDARLRQDLEGTIPFLTEPGLLPHVGSWGFHLGTAGSQRGVHGMDSILIGQYIYPLFLTKGQGYWETQGYLRKFSCRLMSASPRSGLSWRPCPRMCAPPVAGHTELM